MLGDSSVDECYEGQRNWKVDTGYHYRCSLLMGVLLGIDGDVRKLLLAADVDLRERQWRSHEGEWPGQLVDEYWDLRAGETPDGSVRLDRLPGPHSVRRGDLSLRFDYGSAADDRGLERIDRSQRSTVWCCGPPFFERRELMDVDQAAETAHHRTSSSSPSRAITSRRSVRCWSSGQGPQRHSGMAAALTAAAVSPVPG